MLYSVRFSSRSELNYYIIKTIQVWKSESKAAIGLEDPVGKDIQALSVVDNSINKYTFKVQGTVCINIHLIMMIIQNELASGPKGPFVT